MTRVRAARTAAAALASIAAAGAGAWFCRGALTRALAGRHFSTAEKMIESGDAPGAERELELARESEPLHPRALLLLGRLALERNDLERAFLHLQGQVDAFPEDAEGWSALAQVRQQASQPEQAEAAISNAVDRDPDAAGPRLRRAELRLRLGHFRGGAADARAVLRRDPGSAPARKMLAAARDRLDQGGCSPVPAPPPSTEAAAWPGGLGERVRDFLAAAHKKDWATASAIVSRARSDHPRTMLGPWLDGVHWLMSGELAKAEQSLREALAVVPRSHRPISNLAALWSRQHGPGASGDRLVALVDEDPGFAYPLPIAAAAYLEDAQPAKAEATIRRMFRAAPQSPVPFREVARFQLELDRGSDAVATAEQGLSRFSADPILLRQRAAAFARLGDREAALRAWEAALAARDDDQVAAAQLARLLAVRAGDAFRQRALTLVRELECDAPADPEVLGSIGFGLLEAGRDPRAARPWLEAARDRAPDSPQHRYELALAYARTHDQAAARRELDQALRPDRIFDQEPEARQLLHELESAAR